MKTDDIAGTLVGLAVSGGAHRHTGRRHKSLFGDPDSDLPNLDMLT